MPCQLSRAPVFFKRQAHPPAHTCTSWFPWFGRGHVRRYECGCVADLFYSSTAVCTVVAVLLCNSVVAADTMTAGSCWEMQHTTRYPGNLGFGRACNTPPLAALRSLQQRLPTFGRGCVCCCCRACMYVCMYAHTCSIHVAYVHREIS